MHAVLLGKNSILEIVRTGYALEAEGLVARCSNFNRSKINECREKSGNLHRRVLYLVEPKGGNLAVEEADLLDVHDSVVREYPHVKVIIRPEKSECHPQKQHPQTPEEKEQPQTYFSRREHLGKYGDHGGGNEEQAEGREGEKREKGDLPKKEKPMTARYIFDALSFLELDHRSER